jgi:hypothetical protein
VNKTYNSDKPDLFVCYAKRAGPLEALLLFQPCAAHFSQERPMQWYKHRTCSQKIVVTAMIEPIFIILQLFSLYFIYLTVFCCNI